MVFKPCVTWLLHPSIISPKPIVIPRSPELFANDNDIDTWLRRRSLGLRSILDALAQRTTGLGFLALVKTNPRLAATLAYQALGNSLGGYIANLILEHSQGRGDVKESTNNESSLGGGLGGRGDMLSLSSFP